MSQRFTVLPDERFASMQAALAERLRLSASFLSPLSFGDFLDPVMRATLTDGFHVAGGDEGTVWLLDEAREHLVPAFNTGPNAEKFVGQFRQPLRNGIVSMVFASEQPFCENEVFKNHQQDKRLDRQLGLQTCAMIAVPFYFTRQMRGVISCVQLREQGAECPDARDGFTVHGLGAVELAANVLSRLIDHRLLSVTVGWDRS